MYSYPLTGKLSLDVDQTKTLVYPRGCKLHGVKANNPGASAVFIQLFNAKAISDVVLGTTIPFDSILVPAGGSAGYWLESAHFVFENGLVVAVTAGARNGTAPAAPIDVFTFVEET